MAKAKTLRVLTIKQPYASMIMSGEKKREYRSWPPPKDLIGQRLAIHAGQGFVKEYASKPKAEYPFGLILGTVRIVGVIKPNTRNEYFQWKLEDPKRFRKPIPVKGKLRVWFYNPDQK